MRWISLSLLALSLCITGCGTPSFLITPVANSNKLNEEEISAGKGWSPGKVAIIPVEGMIANVRTGGLLQATENPLSLFTQQLEAAEKDPAVKAVVLRVNSPGGTVTASDAMYQLVKRFKARTGKVVVASAQEMDASGAYYVSCAADKIVAQPTSLVGSIGVVFETMEFEGTLAKIGVNADAIKSGSLKDMGSPFRAMKPEERAVMQGMVEEYFTRFVGIVSGNRPVSEQPVADLTKYGQSTYGGTYSGRVFSGERARELGLVDQTGLLEDAIELAKNLAHAKDAAVVMYTRPYGYGGSIYASNTLPPPKADTMQLELPGANSLLPAGFYYLWMPGR
ncbi:MAG TPA: signal peptide peptidase SppA [Tepidisphaeraceae bacterium]|jgi:protease-4